MSPRDGSGISSQRSQITEDLPGKDSYQRRQSVGRLGRVEGSISCAVGAERPCCLALGACIYFWVWSNKFVPRGWRRRTILTVEVGKPSRPRGARRVVWLNVRDTAGALSGTTKTHVI